MMMNLRQRNRGKRVSQLPKRRNPPKKKQAKITEEPAASLEKGGNQGKPEVSKHCKYRIHCKYYI